MKNSNKIDPSIAFCAKSATANFSSFFDKKEVIYRKLINPYNDELQTDCYIAIDKSQSAQLGELTLIDYNADTERLGIKVMNLWVMGKAIAYSKPNDLSEFFPIGEAMAESVTQSHPDEEKPTHLPTITPNDINRFSDALKAILDSGLFSSAIYTDLYQLRSSLDTFESLLSDNDTHKTAQVVKLEVL